MWGNFNGFVILFIVVGFVVEKVVLVGGVFGFCVIVWFCEGSLLVCFVGQNQIILFIKCGFVDVSVQDQQKFVVFVSNE